MRIGRGGLLIVVCAGGCPRDAGPRAGPPAAPVPDRYETVRLQMVKRQVWGRGVRDRAVVAAMRVVPRERFVPDDLWYAAYDDRPLPVAPGRSIAQPYMDAAMIEALALGAQSRVLEICTVAGYRTALLARVAGRVFSVDPDAALALRASEVLGGLGADNVRIRVGAPERGWEAEAPFDAVLVAGAVPRVPGALLDQLAAGGRLVAPVGPTAGPQVLTVVAKDARGVVSVHELFPVRFGPLPAAR